jgi:fumarate hydratase subunit alpha
LRRLPVAEIEEAVSRLFRQAALRVPPEVEELLRSARERERSPLGREVLTEILENARVAREERIPLCQDTGFAVVLLELGQEVHLVGGDLREAVNRGVARAYTEGLLRKSILDHPWQGRNTGDNTPCVLHVEIVPGDRVRVRVMPKGGGSENKSRLKMLSPAEGLEGAKRLVIETVKRAGPDACPPLAIGVGIGGTFDYVGYLAKKALFRRPGERHPRPEVRELEEELEEEIGRLGIGPSGFGGDTTALWVSVEIYPRHIATFPVAVNVQCHAARVEEEVL